MTMKKKIAAALFAGAAFVGFSAEAAAECGELQPARQTIMASEVLNFGSAKELPAESAAPVVAQAILVTNAYSGRGCTSQEVQPQIAAANSWGPGSMVKPTDQIRLVMPKPSAALAAAPAQPAPAASAAPAAQASAAPAPAASASVAPLPVVVAAPKAAPAPPIVAARTMEEVRAPIRAARVEVARIEQKPVAQRTPEEIAFMATNPEKRITDLETKMAKLPETGLVPAVLTAEQSAAITAAMSFKTDLDSLKSDISLLQIGLGIVAGLLIVMAIMLLWGRHRRRKQVEAIVNAKLATVKLDDSFKTLVMADIAGLKSDVTGLKSRFKHDVKKIGETLKPADMKALSDGAEFEYHLLVDGLPVAFDAKVVQHTPSGDALIKIDELPNPVTAKALFVELTDYLERGGALPALKLVNN